MAGAALQCQGSVLDIASSLSLHMLAACLHCMHIACVKPDVPTELCQENAYFLIQHHLTTDIYVYKYILYYTVYRTIWTT